MPTRTILFATISLLLIVSLTQPAESAGMKMKPVATVPMPCDSEYQVISPAGDQVAMRCGDDTWRLVNMSSGTTQYKFDPEPRVSEFKYSPDGRWFAVGRRDGTVEVVPTSGMAEPRRWKSDTRRIRTLEFFPDSSGIVVGASDRPGQIWDLHGTPKRAATLHSDFAGLLACAFSPDGKLLATADGDTVIRFYDTTNWQIVREHRGLTLETFAVAFTADGKRVIAGGPDDRITVLDPSTGSELQKLAKDTDVIWQILSIGSDGRAVILYVDGEGVKPPHLSVENVKTAQFETVIEEKPLTAGGIVGGKLWLGRPEGKILEIKVYE